MSRSLIGQLRVTLGIDTAAFSQGLTRSQQRMRRFSRNMRTGLAVAGVAAAAFAVGFGRSMNQAITHADDMYKASQALGTSTESLTQLAHAAEMSGSSFETLQTGLRRVSTALEDVASGSQGPTARAFDVLGISAQNLDGSLRSVDDIVEDVAEAFASMEDGAQKTAAANAIFGRSGAQLIPMLNAGRDGIQAMREEADRLGITISERAGRSAEAFRDNLSRLRRAFTGIRNQVADALLPVFERFSDALVTIMGDQELVHGISQGLVEVFKRIAVAALEVTKVLYSMGSAAAWAMNGFEGGAAGYEAALARVAEAHRTIDGLIDNISNDRLVTVRMSNDGIGSPDAARSWAQGLRTQLTDAAEAPMNAVGEEIASSIGRGLSEGIGAPMQLTTDAMRQSLESVADQSRQTADAMGSYFGDMFTGLIDGTQKWGDALKNLASNLASNVLNNSLSTLFQSLPGMGGSSGGIGRFLSGLMGGFQIPSLAVGTDMIKSDGLIYAHAGEALMPADVVGGGYTGGGPGGGPSHVYLHLSGDLDARIDERSIGNGIQIVRESTPGIVSQSVVSTGGAIKSGAMDAPMAKRYGLGKTARAR